ncbi:hypothetical protein [Nocardioides sp.]|uniref:hypothetical protein n=1 Tax=Nocardioides sp. TaxID=35761 RepID=UPI002734BB06|nr:hypothetical protein [Nocardioides sp.]MDP3890395.1 hypothetical protein [Nocardioides sp.]
MSPGDVRPLTGDDLDWVVALTRERRERLVPLAPRFWRPAADAALRHRAFLTHLVADPDAVTLRTEHGYLVGVERAGRLVVDDMVVDPPEHWATEGVLLLEHARGSGRLRLVVPVSERERMDVAMELGLEPTEVWWHRDLEPATGLNVVVEDPAVTVDGAVGQLVPAPPVYDPGGPVLLVTSAGSADALTRIQQSAARRGATVAVVVQDPADAATAALLADTGFTVTTYFFG